MGLVETPGDAAERPHTFQSYMIRIKQPERRLEVMKYMSTRGIATRRGVMATHLEPAYRARFPELTLPGNRTRSREHDVAAAISRDGRPRRRGRSFRRCAKRWPNARLGYQVSTFWRFLWVRGGGGAMERSMPPIQKRESAGSMTSSTLERDTVVDCPAAFVRAGDEVVVAGEAGSRVFDGREFVSEAQFHLSFEAHATEFACGPGHRERWLFEAASGHCLSTKPVRLAKDDGDVWDGEIRTCNEEPAAMANQRGLLDFGANHHPRSVAKDQERDVEGVA